MKDSDKTTDLTRRKIFQATLGLATGIPFAGSLLTSQTGEASADKKMRDAQPERSATHNVIRVDSPDGQVRIEFSLKPHRGSKAVPHYQVSCKDCPIIMASPLAIDLADGGIGGSCSVESIDIDSKHSSYHVFPGKRSHVIDQYSEAIISLRELSAPGYQWQLILRAYNDGAAFRYSIPDQKSLSNLTIKDERTTFAFPENAWAYTYPLNSFAGNFETFYKKKRIKDVPADSLLGMPCLVHYPGRGWAAITEANLTDYAGMYLAPVKQGSTMLRSRLSPLPGDSKVAVKASLPHVSPWRVIMTGEESGRLIESDLILNLNEPCALEDTSWIQPGKTTFPWWNGYYVEGMPFKGGLNTATMKYYIDFCAENGIPFHTLDGFKNVAWYGGPIRPYKGAGITSALPTIDLPEVLRHAHRKGVKIRFWMHWKAAKMHMERAFPLYRSWGIEGVMLDFFNRNDQEAIAFQRKVLEKAAENHLTVVMHNCSKPTGLRRTYPHFLTSEGVLNLEYDKFSKKGCPPKHEVTVPFTRMLAGPMDFHQGSFRGVPVEDFKPRNIAPHVMGTPPAMLATYIVYQNHLSMVADYPKSYRNHPLALAMLVKIPTTWDDTKVLNGSVGKYITIARRSGSDWYLGAMTDRHPRTFEIPLDFLEAKNYRAKIYADDLTGETSDRLLHYIRNVTAQDQLTLKLHKFGGYVACLSPAKK
jgi:alpha-glucosidase